MTKQQERHLREVKQSVSRRIDRKYRQGQKEHGGDLFRKGPAELLDEALNELADLNVYLLTLRSTFTFNQRD